MIIIEDERNTASRGFCENCKQQKLKVRAVDTFGWMRESRGHFIVCFDCFWPRIHWRGSEKGKDYWSPVEFVEM